MFGLVLGILGLGFAIWQTFLAQQQTRDAKRLSENIVSIYNSLSTRYIEVFPLFYPLIANLISKAKSKIVICCDFPAYGSFSDNKTWIIYRAAIESKLDEGIEVNIICLNQKRRTSRIQEQLMFDDSTWKEWSEKNKNKIKAFLCNRFPELAGRTPQETEVKITDKFNSLTSVAFLGAFTDTDKEVVKNGFPKAILTEVDEPLTVHFWIVDGKEAIFSIPVFETKPTEIGFETNPTEIGFVTSDAKLIEAFLILSQSYQHSGVLRGDTDQSQKS